MVVGPLPSRFSPDSPELWDHATGKVHTTLERAGPFCAPCLFTPDGKTVLAAGGAGKLHRWDVKTGKLLQSFQGINIIPMKAEISHDGSLILCVGCKSLDPVEQTKLEVKVLDVRTGEVVSTHEATRASGIVPGKNTWAVHSRNGPMTLWERK